MKIVFEYKDFWSNFTKTSKNFPIFSGDISRFLLLQANLSLRACLAMCLIFRENPGLRAHELVAYEQVEQSRTIVHSRVFTCTLTCTVECIST